MNRFHWIETSQTTFMWGPLSSTFIHSLLYTYVFFRVIRGKRCFRSRLVWSSRFNSTSKSQQGNIYWGTGRLPTSDRVRCPKLPHRRGRRLQLNDSLCRHSIVVGCRERPTLIPGPRTFPWRLFMWCYRCCGPPFLTILHHLVYLVSVTLMTWPTLGTENEYCKTQLKFDWIS